MNVLQYLLYRELPAGSPLKSSSPWESAFIKQKLFSGVDVFFQISFLMHRKHKQDCFEARPKIESLKIYIYTLGRNTIIWYWHQCKLPIRRNR